MKTYTSSNTKKPSKKFWIILVISILSALTLIFTFNAFKTNDKSKNTDNLIAQNCTTSDKYLGLHRVELATSLADQEQGLMNRTEMCEDEAMLFVYDKPQNLSFWMKDTLVSLDIIFITEQGVIDSIYQNTTPKRLLPTYNSKSPCKYVLESKAGFSQRNNLKSGDKIEIQKLLEVSIQYVPK